MAECKPIQADEFHHDGRGPELMRVFWSDRGSQIVAIEYYNPEDPYDAEHLRYVRFIKPQVVMCTTEEVIGDLSVAEAMNDGHAAAFDLGKSAWLAGFNQRHLFKCSHYRLMFYDELYDVIAEALEFSRGPFSTENGQRNR